MLFGLLLITAEEARHLVIPATQRAVGGSLLKGRVQLQHDQQFVTNSAAILESLAQPEGFGECAHVRRDPEVSFGAIRREGNRRTAGRDARLEIAAALRRWTVSTEPVACPRQLPRS